MALVTVQRSPSSSNSSSTISISETDDDSDDRLKKSCSSFFAVKGAALFLPRGTDCRPIKKNPVVGDLQVHLQSMFVLLRPQDTIVLAVRLESVFEVRIRYLLLISSIGVEDTEENVILGVDVLKRSATIGLVLPVWADTEVTLNGDGGFTIKAKNRLHVFKPVSVQAMWSALQALNRACETARKYTYFSGGLNLTWTSYYDARVLSKPECIHEWNLLPDLQSHESVEHIIQRKGDLYKPTARELTERLIAVKLREVLLQVDIEEVTSKEIRTKLEEVVGNGLKEFNCFIDEQMIIILRQMDSASKIFDFLYLGSEWNAGNLVELEQIGIGYILNVTKEIDNFFPGRFKYHNIRLPDVEESDLLRHWEDTHRFLSKAKEAGSKALVHCKMGISRSAATVIAFAMKENRWPLEEALKYVKERRKVINPNRGFRQQLEEYQGILDASNQRHNKLWRSKSESSLSTTSSAEGNIHNIHMADIHLGDINPADLQPSISEEPSSMCDPRRRSWSPNERTSDALLGPSPEDTEVSRSAISSPMYLDSPTAHCAAAGFAIGDGESDLESDDEEWREIKIAVPEVPLSPTQSGVSQFPPAGNVSQKIFSIEGVTTSESTEEAVKTLKDQKVDVIGADQVMIAAEDPGKFIIEGAITGESTEEDFEEATKEPHGIETGQLAGKVPLDTKVPSEEGEGEEDKEETVPLTGATAASEQSCELEERSKTPINFPMYLPLAEGNYMFPPEADLESVTSSVAVTVGDDDDYMKKANFEDEDILEDDEVQDDHVNVMPEVPGARPDPDRLLSPEEKEAFFTPEEGVLPVLPVTGSQVESEVVPGTEKEQREAVASGNQDKGDISPHAQDDESESKEEEADGAVFEPDTVPPSQELNLDMDMRTQTDLNTNNNSSNESSPRGTTVVSVPVTKDLTQSIVKVSLSPLERRNISLLSSVSQSPESPESDGYKTASSDTTETPGASPMVYAKDYPKGFVRSRARSYETQISGESEDQSVTDSCKSEAATPQVSSVEIQDKQSIPLSAGAVLKQRKDIEERLKSESEGESSPPVTRSGKFFEESTQSDASEEPSKSELSPPPSDSPQEKPFASPSLQSLEKGIVKKLTKQLLSSETPLTKETSKTNTADTAPQLDTSLTSGGNAEGNQTKAVDKNQGKSQQVSSVVAPDNDREKTIKSSSASEILLEPTKKDSETNEEPSPEQASGEEKTTVVLRKKEPTYSRFGDEKIPLEPGIVKRHTQDYEQRHVEKSKEEVEMMEKSSTTEPEPPVDSSSPVALEASPDISVEVQSEVTEPGTESAYPEEGSSWRVGDVRRHKKVFEDMKGADGAELLDSSKPSTVSMSQDSWEKKLTPEELENIKELGKIVLGRGNDDSEETDEEEEEEEEVMDGAEGGEPEAPENEGRFIHVNERIKKLEMGIDKPRPSHVDLKRSSSIARMSSEKISPTSARRRYEKRKVIIRSKADLDSGENSPTTETTGDGATSPRNNQPTIKEMDRESSSSSLDKEDSEVVVGAIATEPQGTEPSPRERLRSKSDGQTEELRTSYKETFEESTQDAEIQRVLGQAHKTLLKNPPPHLKTTITLGAGPEQGDASAQGTGQKRKRNHGNSHPLSKLTAHARKHPFYSTM